MGADDIKNKSNFIAQILASDSLVIYGAGTMGRTVLKCLTEKPYDLSIECFIVKSLDDNADIVDGLPVVDIEHASEYRSSTVLIALNGKYIPEVLNDLKEAGFSDLVPVSFDGDEYTKIRGGWIRSNGILPNNIRYLSDIEEFGKCTHDESSLPDDVNGKFHIYVVHSAFDKVLSETPGDEPYEIGIQVGSALTDKHLFDVRDNIGGDNISEKNRKYCELTGIYWAWKNDRSDYVGFSHYRRKFLLSEEDLAKIIAENIDVVVTEPLLNFVTVRGQYAKDHIVEDWDTFIGVIEDIAPDYLEAAIQVQNGIYYFAYNMYIMKREIFDEYCSFIFPILAKCEELIGSKEDVYQNRYVGFLAERLLSVFLTKNSDYSVAIAEKHFIE